MLVSEVFSHNIRLTSCADGLCQLECCCLYLHAYPNLAGSVGFLFGFCQEKAISMT